MIQIRAMQPDEIVPVSELLCACYRWLGLVEGFTAAEVEFLLRERGTAATVERESARETYLVAVDEGCLVGMTSFRRNEITKLYVDPQLHRRGIGRQLFAQAATHIAGQGFADVCLGTLGTSTMPFYETMGMRVAGRKQVRLGSGPTREVQLMKLRFE